MATQPYDESRAGDSSAASDQQESGQQFSYWWTPPENDASQQVTYQQVSYEEAVVQQPAYQQSSARQGGTGRRRVSTGSKFEKFINDHAPSWFQENYYRLATIALIVVNVIVFIVEFVLSGFDFDIHTQVLYVMGAMYAPAVQSVFDLYRFVAPMFLHMDPIHLIMNMVALYSVGEVLEYVLGKGNYLLLYFVSGITGNALSYVTDIVSGSYSISAGASTAVFGLFVAVALLAVLCKGSSRQLVAYSKSMVSIIVINLVYSLLVPGVSISGHLGGAIGGLIAMFMVPSKNLKVSNTVRIVVAVAWVAIMLIMLVFFGVIG